MEHFKAEGMPRSTIYDIIKCAQDGISVKRQTGCGRKPKIMDKSGLTKLCKLFDHKCANSQRKGAKFMKCSQYYINKTLKRKTSLQKRIKKKIPKRTSTQKALYVVASIKIRRILFEILDDESYFFLSVTEIKGNKRHLLLK